ncbi:hypothetical protein [Nitratireductor luteus]|uniref:hypothetical protein n=1 Tax=Nitratireductor luteus TaxID=2976980 RepID=UPI00223EE9D6|nr:hypothetical protein [Nitratireductor luteus]
MRDKIKSKQRLESHQRKKQEVKIRPPVLRSQSCKRENTTFESIRDSLISLSGKLIRNAPSSEQKTFSPKLAIEEKPKGLTEGRRGIFWLAQCTSLRQLS